jgi:hypothetical protein
VTLLSQTLVLYLLIGAAVAGAVYIVQGDRNQIGRWFAILTAVPFWPLYLPILLSGPDSVPDRTSADQAESKITADEMAVMIEQVDAELQGALGSLDGWAEDVLARERDRIQELRGVWTAQAARIRQMDRLLSLPQYAAPEAVAVGEDAGSADLAGVAERLRTSRLARRQNIERLAHVRRRAYADLMGTLAWVRELVSMIHLARFTGAPPARAEELVAQIAAAVEGLSEVTWQEHADEHYVVSDRRSVEHR